MEKQKKQLLGLLVILIVAVIAFIVVKNLPASYEVTNLNADDVTKLVYTNENGTLTLNKDGDNWICDEDRSVDIDADKVSTMVGKVASLTSENKIENVEDIAQYGLDAPSLTILVSDGTTSYTILIGDYNETTYTYYMCLESDKSTVYTTNSVTITSFKSNTLEDITAEEETETETETESEAEEIIETDPESASE